MHASFFSPAVFDARRNRTRELIGFVVMDILEAALAKDLDTRVLDEDADVYVVRYEDGVIVSKSPNAGGDVFAKVDGFDDMKASFSFDSQTSWDDRSHDGGAGAGTSRLVYTAPLEGGGILTASPVPLPPVALADDPDYRPDVYVVQKISAGFFDVVYEIEGSIDADVRKNIMLTVVLGIIGFAVVMLILAVMSNVLTKPLNWITEVARCVINKDYLDGEGSSGRDGAEGGMEQEGDTSTRFIGFDEYHESAMACVPRTEIGQLVVEFQTMVRGFSRDGACKVAEPQLFQIRNEMTWHSDFALLYSREGLPRKSFRDTSISTETTHSERSQSLMGSSLDEEAHRQEDVEADRQPQASRSTNASSILITEGIKGEQESAASSKVTIGHIQSEAEPDKVYSHEEGEHNPYQISTRHQEQLQSPEHGENELSAVLHEHSQGYGSDSGMSDRKQELDRGQPDDAQGHETHVHPDRLDKRESTAPAIPQSSAIATASATFPSEPRRISFAPLPSASTFCVIPAPVKVNRGPVLGAPKSTSKPMLNAAGGTKTRAPNVCCSTLFWWIVLLMALPVFLTNSTIGAIASSSITGTIPAWVGSAESASTSIETDVLHFLADRKASVLSTLVQRPVRDLHFMARITGWLVFGGVQRSGTLTDIDSATEECKFYPPNECPAQSMERMPCSCDWECLRENKELFPCIADYNVTDSRYLQRQNFVVQKLDADPVTGNRHSSPSFPAFSDFPNSTSWWQDVSSLPGSEVGPNGASGYKTLYDRVVVSSSSAVLNFPIYNYATGLGNEKRFLGGYLSFEKDGLFFGWAGCYYSHSFLSGFQSSVANGATLIDSSLCPDGKYGFDPRCRSWYATGRDSYLREQTPIHVTAPYQFASNPELQQAASMTSPIANPSTGEYAGQVLLDYVTIELGNSLKMLSEPLSFLITPDEDILGGDTVVGPNKSMEWASSPIGDLLFLHEPDSSNRYEFERQVLPLMKSGAKGQKEFFWTTADGSKELMCLYFAPVSARAILSMAPDDFAAGVKVSNSLVYSIGVGRPCDDIKQPFRTVEDDVNEDLTVNTRVYLAINVTSTVLFIFFSAIAAAYTAVPMIKLLNIVSNANMGEFGDSIPPLEGGSKEVQGVYNTFAKLNKIVRVSNTAFFSGNLEMAHHFVSDALSLYRKVNDQKAIGVACNNLANTLFAMSYERLDQVHCCESCADNCTISEALALYDEAIELGSRDFDETPEGDLKVDYAIQLSDRLFNRGLYLLFIAGYECAPEDSRERGYNDVTVARNLHYDIRDNLLENKQLFSCASSYFSRLLRRINCLAAFYDDIGLREIWDAEDVLDEADQLAAAAWGSKTQCPLFREVNQTGRRQQLESSAILLAMQSNDHVQAAKLGMRMLVEDMFVLESSFGRAAEALVRVMKDEEVDFSRRTVACVRDDLRSMLRSCRKESLDIGKNVILAMELGPRWADSPMLEELNAGCLALYDCAVSPDDNFGAVANNVKDTLTVELGTKEENEGRQRAFIDVATSSSTSDSIEACFPIGLQMLIDSALSLQSDSFMILITDGSALDTMDVSSVKSQIERMNSERKYQIHVLIMRIDIDDDRSTRLLEDLASVSRLSKAVDVSSDHVEPAFQSIANVVNGRPSSQFISFLTMEKF
jgi:hypothetical protein